MKARNIRLHYLFLISSFCLTVSHMCHAAATDEFVADIESSGYKQCLNGTWQFRLDPNNIGEKQQWCKPASLDEWKTVTVPSTYNIYEKGLKRYQGKGWYSKTFRLGKELGKNERVIIRFLGVPIRAKVWLNAKKLGEHLFPYTPFEFDSTEYLDSEGENVLVVLADNKALERAIPDPECGRAWWLCGGICRDVYLEVRPSAAITNLWLDTTMAGRKWSFVATAIVTNYGKKQVHNSIAVNLKDPDNKVVWKKTQDIITKPGENNIVLSGSLNGIKPWSPDNPILYEMTVSIEGERPYSRTIKTGFRQIETRGNGIYLNGKKMLLRGMSRHEFLAGHANVVPRERTLEDIKDFKGLGCNFLRTAHYTQHPYLHELCDEYGLLVWTEIPAWQSISDVLSDPAVIEKWGKPQIAEMINRYRRYPSVVVWSVGNEFSSERKDVARYVEQTTYFVREMDPTRLVTFASHRHQNDVCFGYVDFISINEYYGWYVGTVNDVGTVLDKIHEKFPDKPILVSEFGSGGTIDAASDSWPTNDQGCFSLDCQVRFLKAHMDQIFAPQRRDYVAGGLIWLYNDFDNFATGVWNKRPPKWKDVNLKGLVTIDRKRKPSFYMVKSYFHSLDK
jgi:beta-galactosidase/beta-glucuronidase